MESAVRGTGSENLLSGCVAALLPMSVRKAVSQELQGFVELTQNLIDSFAHGGKGSDERAVHLTKQLLDSDRRLQGAVGKLLEQQALQRKLEKARRTVERLDGQVLSFVMRLAALEQSMHDACVDPSTLVDTPAVRSPRKQKAAVGDVVALAQRLSRMSHPPLAMHERHGAPVLPPAPQEDSMAMSLLHKTEEELLAGQGLGVKEEEEEGGGEAGGAMGIDAGLGVGTGLDANALEQALLSDAPSEWTGGSLLGATEEVVAVQDAGGAAATTAATSQAMALPTSLDAGSSSEEESSSEDDDESD